MDRLIGDWYVIARSESVFDETGQCTVKSIDKKNMDSTLTLKTKEQKVDRQTGKFGPQETIGVGQIRRPNITATDGEFEYKFDDSSDT